MYSGTLTKMPEPKPEEKKLSEDRKQLALRNLRHIDIQRLKEGRITTNALMQALERTGLKLTGGEYYHLDHCLVAEELNDMLLAGRDSAVRAERPK